MEVKSVSNEQNFLGNVILKNAISPKQKYLFDMHKPALEQKIKNLPFDLFVEQSKSKKSIILSTNVKDAKSYSVRRSTQDFEKIADLVIEDAKGKSELYKTQEKVEKMFDCQKSILLNIITGDFKTARNFEKNLAKQAVNDFETYKLIPKVNIACPQKEIVTHVAKQSIKYRLYKAFTPKTQEERKFLKMRKDYLKTLKAENKEQKTVHLNFPSFYF